MKEIIMKNGYHWYNEQHMSDNDWFDYGTEFSNKMLIFWNNFLFRKVKIKKPKTMDAKWMHKNYIHIYLFYKQNLKPLVLRQKLFSHDNDKIFNILFSYLGKKFKNKI